MQEEQNKEKESKEQASPIKQVHEKLNHLIAINERIVSTLESPAFQGFMEYWAVTMAMSEQAKRSRDAESQRSDTEL